MAVEDKTWSWVTGIKELFKDTVQRSKGNDRSEDSERAEGHMCVPALTPA